MLSATIPVLQYSITWKWWVNTVSPLIALLSLLATASSSYLIKYNLNLTLHPTLFSSPGRLSSFPLSSVGVNFPRGMLGDEESLECEEERERVAICCLRQSACVLGWADGGSGWHLGGTGTSAGRHEHHSTPLHPSSPSPSLNTSLSLLLRSHPQGCVNQHNLSSALSTQGRQQYASSVWPGSRGVGKAHNQGNKRLILPRWTSDLMQISFAQLIKMTH